MDEIRNVIEMKDVTKNYGDFKLDKVSFSVPEGSVCGFIGQNGAGKTTTINLILDVIKRDAGEITLFGESIDSGSARLREDIGVVFDEMSGSVWPAAILHAVNNAQPSILNGYINYENVPGLMGTVAPWIGRMAALAIAATAVLLIWKKKENG
ncbi:MAG: ATP-binding cassette domain-containing protein [Lachnospiraceae bacterium]|nr:ATP-binding cassette domain-containing protein [Lachnospiraceae bacterium]